MKKCQIWYWIWNKLKISNWNYVWDAATSSAKVKYFHDLRALVSTEWVPTNSTVLSWSLAPEQIAIYISSIQFSLSVFVRQIFCNSSPYKWSDQMIVCPPANPYSWKSLELYVFFCVRIPILCRLYTAHVSAGRNVCRSCRFQKCLDVGMEPDGKHPLLQLWRQLLRRLRKFFYMATWFLFT